MLLQKLIKPYKVGKHIQSTYLRIPSEIAKALNFDPLTSLFLLKVTGHNRLDLKIICAEDLDKINELHTTAAHQFDKPEQKQVTNKGVVI